LSGYKPELKEIIYTGKTESSQQSRDADTHFASGKTGSSTLRRSFGSMLREELSLSPIPRSEAERAKRDTSKFKFDPESEQRLTKWMKENLGLSFYAFPRSPSEIDELETILIHKLKPILNIDRKNPGNPFASKIKSLRKETGEMAYNTIPDQKKAEMPLKVYKKVETINAAIVHKYEDIWNQLSKSIIECIRSGGSHSIYIGETPFQRVGNRKLYSFNLEFNNEQVANNISGSAVARDLARILLSKSDFLREVKGGFIKISLDKSFTLHIKS
jgi:hypothetical protein